MTSTSRLTGSAEMSSCSSSASATLPHGAVSTHTTYFTSPESRSEKSVIPAGLSLGVTRTITLVAKSFGSEASTDSALSIVVLSAVASTSAGEPSAACWARVADESNASFTVTPGWSFSNCAARSVKVPVNEDAARTVIVVSSSPPHADSGATAQTRTTAAAAVRRTRDRMALPRVTKGFRG